MCKNLKTMSSGVTVVGAGLAGSEAAWQIAKRGVRVTLIDMKPEKMSPAHTATGFAELVCSNSLRSERIENAAGLLKEELKIIDSLIMRAAEHTRVPAGGALAVDRNAFSEYVTKALCAHENIDVISRHVKDIGEIEGVKIFATGPLTSPELSASFEQLLGKSLHFFDAAAPIITADSVDYSRAFSASRYDRGSDYINCPMNEEQYGAFYDALITAECAELRDFENSAVFEGCMPVEVMASRGRMTLCFGPLKPAGLTDPHTGKMPYAVLQLRKENAQGTLLNLVGFQTHLKFGEQKRVFSMIPGLENAEFVRYGVMHKNTYINSPGKLDNTYRLRDNPDIYFAGQITGVEGYVESTASGALAGIAAALRMQGKDVPAPGDKTAMGALAHYVSGATTVDFQPMNVNFGIIAPSDIKIRKKQERYAHIGGRAIDIITQFAKESR